MREITLKCIKIKLVIAYRQNEIIRKYEKDFLICKKRIFWRIYVEILSWFGGEIQIWSSKMRLFDYLLIRLFGNSNSSDENEIMNFEIELRKITDLF